MEDGEGVGSAAKSAIFAADLSFAGHFLLFLPVVWLSVFPGSVAETIGWRNSGVDCWQLKG